VLPRQRHSLRVDFHANHRTFRSHSTRQDFETALGAAGHLHNSGTLPNADCVEKLIRIRRQFLRLPLQTLLFG
jgi:hypothetical protein